MLELYWIVFGAFKMIRVLYYSAAKTVVAPSIPVVKTVTVL